MKKTIFISSTYKDLVKERKAVWELLKRYDVNILLEWKNLELVKILH